MLLPIFEDPTWQMSRGERAAVEGVLASLRPRLALEIGSMEGACLRRIALHSAETHSFDLQPPALEQPPNVTMHNGNSHELLPAFLEELVAEGRNVDFVMVDGDHTPDGVRQDLEDLLNSPAVAKSVILIHDTANERVRAGVDSVRFAAWPKVAHVELDWIPGQLFAEPSLRNELWYGLGLIVVQAGRVAYGDEVYERRYHSLGPLLAEVRERELERESGVPQGSTEHDLAILREWIADLRAELGAAWLREAEQQRELSDLTAHYERARRALENITQSASWRMTEPLRAAKRRAGRTSG